MDQHTPTVTREDVVRVVAREFPPDQISQVLSILSSYGTESYHREVDRVHLDILKLASGKIDRIVRETENACCDYRDTMVSAEYPNYGRKMFKLDKLSPEERNRIIDADRDQYESWLHRETD
jgi:hypothetical protein